MNEELVAIFLDALALAGDDGAVYGHQTLIPRLKPPAVPLLREGAAWNKGRIKRVNVSSEQYMYAELSRDRF